MYHVCQDTPFPDFFIEILHDLDKYLSHKFRADWQHQQLNNCLTNLPPEEGLMVMDYAENYSVRYQNEVQSAFWDQVQVTIYPVMVYYRKPLGESDKYRLVKHSIIGISNDTKHDADGVGRF